MARAFGQGAEADPPPESPATATESPADQEVSRRRRASLDRERDREAIAGAIRLRAKMPDHFDHLRVAWLWKDRWRVNAFSRRESETGGFETFISASWFVRFADGEILLISEQSKKRSGVV